MLISTRYSRMLASIRNWHEIYHRNADTWLFSDGTTLGQYRRRLAAMGSNPTPDQVIEVIGNYGIDVECQECGQRREILFDVGFDVDYEQRMTQICVPCMVNAAAMAMGVEQSEVLIAADRLEELGFAASAILRQIEAHVAEPSEATATN